MSKGTGFSQSSQLPENQIQQKNIRNSWLYQYHLMPENFFSPSLSQMCTHTHTYECFGCLRLRPRQSLKERLSEILMPE